MHSKSRFLYAGFFLLLLLVMLSGCSASPAAGGSGSPVAGGATPTPAGATVTPTPSPCLTRASPTAEAWVNGASNPQVMGSFCDGPETQLSNFVYPLGLPNEGQFGSDSLVALAWSPDPQYLAAAVAVNVGQAVTLFPYVVNTGSHVTTRVMLPGSAGIAEKGAANRIFAWADTHTLLIFGGFGGGNNGSAGTVSYSYDVTTNSVTPLPGVTAA